MTDQQQYGQNGRQLPSRRSYRRANQPAADSGQFQAGWAAQNAPAQTQQQSAPVPFAYAPQQSSRPQAPFQQIPQQIPPEPPSAPERTFGQKLRYALLTILGWFGELLITASYLVVMFAVWQLFWTSYEVEAVQQQQVQVFEKNIPKKSPDVISKDIRKTPPPKVGPVPTGDVFATMYVPRWNMTQIPVAESVEQWVLDQAFAGHYPDTTMPGEVGNFAVAGHRRTYGNAFRRIHELKKGDPIVVATRDAYIVYKVTNHEIVLPSQSEVLSPVPNHPGQNPTKRIMTMTTCHPEWDNSHRYIQYLEFDHWVPRESGLPAEIVKG